MNFDDKDKLQNWLAISRLPHKMGHGDINKLPNHAYDDELAKVALTHHGWKALVKIQQIYCSLPRKTNRYHRDYRAVKLLLQNY